MSKYSIFVLMPFDSEFDEFYKFLKTTIEEDNEFRVFRADDLLNQQNILKDIVQSIHNSNLIISDLTGLNSNVFYELGLAHSLRKKVILLTQDIDELPFDLRSYKVLEYSTHFSKISNLKNSLKNLLAGFKNDTTVFGTPITDWLPFEEKTISNNLNKNTNYEAEIESVEDFEDGFLDYLADMTESMEALTELMQNLTKKTEDLNFSISEKTEQITKSWENPSTGSTSYVRKLARKTGEILKDYGIYTKSINTDYSTLWEKFESSATKLVTVDILLESKENIDAFNDFLESQLLVKNGMENGKEGLTSFIDSMIALKGIQKDINRSTSIVEVELKTFIGLMDKSISTLERVIALGRERLKKPSSS